jgi:ABC-type dipeptide/oligopeptide/nickel transport system permease component
MLARYTRSSITEVLRLDFIRVARAKGVSNSSVYVKHALRNALLPVLTILGMAIPSLLVGSFLIETMFSVPGTGRFFVDAIGRRDYPVVMGVALLYSVIVVTCNLLTDLLYAVVDPRVRFN